MEPSIWDHVKRKPRVAKCHPDRKHRGRGMCHLCYYVWYHKVHPRTADSRTIESYAERTERAKKYMAQVEASLTGHHCALCGIDYNPNKKKINNHPDHCSLCERDVDRSVYQFVDLMPYHKEVFK
jgi:hypothetical protein